MNTTAASRAFLLLVGGAVALTAGIAAAATDRDTARRHCMALARMATPPGGPPSLGVKRHVTVTFNQCMERAGFGADHAR
jgi:hypothetical protein